MEKNSEKNIEEQKRLEVLNSKKKQNIQILENRIHELEINKQRKERENKK